MRQTSVLMVRSKELTESRGAKRRWNLRMPAVVGRARARLRQMEHINNFILKKREIRDLGAWRFQTGPLALH